MTGGAHDYLHLDMMNVVVRLQEMADESLTDQDLPESIGNDLHALAEDLDDHRDLIQAIEKYHSGDVSADRVIEQYRGDEPIGES